LGWDRYTGLTGAKVVMNSFGASAPIEKLQAKFGFTLDNVVKLAKQQAEMGRNETGHNSRSQP
jgi:transketolase